MPSSRDFVIAALDFDSADTALEKVQLLGDSIGFYKVGMQLFFSANFFIIEELHKFQKKVFLDLKLNDIPNTIEAVLRVIINYPIDYLSLFCGEKAMEAAANVVNQNNSSLKLVKITKLTSEPGQNLQDDCQFVASQAQKALNSGAHGIVCSGHETAFVRETINNDSFTIINPGIRLPNHLPPNDDQQRVVTPREAYLSKASHIVVGRPIFNAPDIKLAAQSIFDQIDFSTPISTK